ncbi:hypothetical protein [Ornithinibacillus californiensis]|uniref:hypothetical protein n=1 Tax=Ornithinibacillus californiensis TaxID=161536 RepID=UPI00064D793C|nr:hypothetical protein [Ornithinibacillus californiensis]
MSVFTRFTLIFFIAFIIVNLPLFRVGYVIDWVDEATIIQKITAHIKEGLAVKLIVSIVIAILGNAIYTILKQKQKE